MKPARLILIALIVLLTTACGGSKPQFSADTPVGKYGRLQLKGTALCDADGNPVQLKGLSFMDVSWFGEYANEDCMKWLRDDWGCSVIRAALYTEDSGHFVGEKSWDKVDKAVEAATAAGLYVIIDWHILGDGNPQKYKKEARAFFTRMARTYRNYPNVLYEICNEPNGRDVRWKTEIKPYAQELVKVIRAHDRKGIILIGSSNWSQDVDQAAADPVSGKNIMYVAHFYAGSHGDGLQRKIKEALELGAPVFVSEWGTTRADTSGGVFYYPTLYWIRFMEENGISWCNWSLSTREEFTSVLRNTAQPRGGWSLWDLTESGLLVRSLIRKDRVIHLFSEGFETENFISGGWDRVKTRITRDKPHQGEIAASFGAGSTLTKSKPTANLTDLVLSIAYRTASPTDPQPLRVEWSDGTRWHLLEELPPSAEWTERSWTLPDRAGKNYGFGFRLAAGDMAPDNAVFVDNILLSGALAE